MLGEAFWGAKNGATSEPPNTFANVGLVARLSIAGFVGAV